MYGVQLDRSRSLLANHAAERAGLPQCVSARGFADTAILSPGRPWTWLTRAGLQACGTRYGAAPPALPRLPHVRAATARPARYRGSARLCRVRRALAQRARPAVPARRQARRPRAPARRGGALARRRRGARGQANAGPSKSSSPPGGRRPPRSCASCWRGRWLRMPRPRWRGRAAAVPVRPRAVRVARPPHSARWAGPGRSSAAWPRGSRSGRSPPGAIPGPANQPARQRAQSRRGERATCGGAQPPRPSRPR